MVHGIVADGKTEGLASSTSAPLRPSTIAGRSSAQRRTTTAAPTGLAVAVGAKRVASAGGGRVVHGRGTLIPPHGAAAR
jgi:hypothetical protein